jgi:hypothetical protein
VPGSEGHLTLFNTEAFSVLNLSGSRTYRRFDTSAEGALVGTIAGVVDDGRFESGFSAPFGGFDFVRPNETVDRVELVVDTALAEVRRAGCREVTFRLRPTAYGEVEVLVQSTLLNRGLSVVACDLNQHIDLRPLSGVAAYMEQLKSPARRALRHAAEEPFAFTEAHEPEEWQTGYDVLAENRRAKGRQLSLGPDYIDRIRSAFPRQIRMFVLRHGTAPCAAALTYDVLPATRLVVYWGDGHHQLPRSPMNYLALKVVEHSLASKTALLDLGISSDHGVPDHGLVRFKRSILAKTSLRLVLRGAV